MIGKAELLQIARVLQLNPDIVQKDYALGWVLAGIYTHPRLRDSWVFKGGTCLKKCYVETFRFSEDLDFTLLKKSHLNEAFLKEVFAEVADWIYEHSGLDFPVDDQDFEIYKNRRGNPSCHGRLSYRGPNLQRSDSLPRVKIDLTADELLALSPVNASVFHPYSDVPDGGIEVLAYAFEEAYGEKVRALSERARPRDLYDVINLYRNWEARPAPSDLLDVLRQKCDFKGISVPQESDLEKHKADIESSWNDMLAHQLLYLPPFNSFWSGLSEFFAWLTAKSIPTVPAALTLAPGDSVVRERILHLPVHKRLQPNIEAIRFAATNHLCVELDYINQGHATYIVEPYSLRRTQQREIVLHAWNVRNNMHDRFHLRQIQDSRLTNHSFVPRYAIELVPVGPTSLLWSATASG